MSELMWYAEKHVMNNILIQQGPKMFSQYLAGFHLAGPALIQRRTIMISGDTGYQLSSVCAQ